MATHLILLANALSGITTQHFNRYMYTTKDGFHFKEIFVDLNMMYETTYYGARRAMRHFRLSCCWALCILQ